MTSAHEPVLHALSVDPCLARPGETVCVIFRTRNLGTAASPPGTVAFLLGDGLEALDETEVAVRSVAPGEDVFAVVRARVVTPLDDRTEIPVQGALRVPDAVLGTNVCAVLVRSRAVLDGAASGTFVESIGADRVRVRAVVTNEGDGAARDVRVDVPAPAGCVRVDDDVPGGIVVERLEVGASVTVAFDARIVEPVAVLAAADGVVRLGGERSCMLAVREVVVMEPVIAAPCVAVRPSRRSVDITVDVRNDGWVDARDVRVRIVLPAPLRAIDGSIVVDGVPAAARGGRRAGGDPPFARVERSGGAHVVIIPVPARSTVRIALAGCFPGGWGGGTVVASAGSHEVAAPFEPRLVRDVRVRLIETTRVVAPGGEARVAAEVVNAGDVSEALFFCITGPGIVVAADAVSRTVAPGSVAVVELAVRANDTVPDNASLLLSVVACDVERERARAEFAVVVRDLPPSCCDERSESDARGLPATVHAALHGAGEVFAGAPFTVRAGIDVEDRVELLTLRVPEVAGGTYVPGSTCLDGRSLLDRAGESPLAGDGLLLRGVPAGTRITAEWTLLAHPTICDQALMVAAVLDVDGQARPCEPIAVHVRGRDAFASQPAGMTYHVDACVVGEARREPDVIPSDTAPPPAVSPDPVVALKQPDDAFTFAFAFDANRLADVARLLTGAGGGGLVAHVLAVRAFLPDSETSDDRGVAALLDGVRCALRDVFDRLFVKLRIPGFDVTSDDLDDLTVRSAMIGLFERLVHGSPGAGHGKGLTVRITRERARELLVAFTDASYGAPSVLRALVALLPTRCGFDPALGAALAKYACALDDVLARYDGVPLELFDDALARASDRALDDARAALVAALSGHAAFTEVAC